MEYKIEWYRKSKTIGIRRKMPEEGKTQGTQIFSFGGRTCVLSEAWLKDLGQKCLRKLHIEGKSEDAVKQFARKAAGIAP